MLKAGIIGLPNVGKSTLFNALVENAKAQAANFPFCTIEPNKGIVSVPDQRLQELGNLSSSQNIIPTKIEFVDIAGLVKGASKGEGLGNKFLSNIREVDAIVHVVRQVRTSKEAAKEDTLLEKIEEELEKGLSVRSISLNEEENLIIKQLGFLTAKPIIYATNLNENDLAEGNDFSSTVQSFASNENTECIKISAQVESELIELEPEDKKDYLIGLGVEEGGLSSLIRSTYKLLGLKTYFTTGEKETKAWTIKDGMTAPQAAGVIHTDFEKGFIRAQTISYQNLIDSGSIANAKTKGLLRSEGKEYIVNEGDVMEFLFNV